VGFISAIWPKLQEDPAQLSFFFTERSYTSKELLRGSSGRGGDGKPKPTLLLFSALMPFMFSMKRSGNEARKALVIAIQLQDSRLNTFILGHSNFCEQVAQGVAEAYRALPQGSTTDGGAAGGAGAEKGGSVWGGSMSEKDQQAQVATEAKAIFDTRLKFCNAIALAGRTIERGSDMAASGHAQQAVPASPGAHAANLSSPRSPTSPSKSGSSSMGGTATGGVMTDMLYCLRHSFFEPVLAPALMQTSEERARVATEYARGMIKQVLGARGNHCNSSPLLHEMVSAADVMLHRF
jgi:hypothetical protein